MNLPEWASRALEDGSDTEYAHWKRQTRERLALRWGDVQADRWRVPDKHSCYGCSHFDLRFSAADLVRKRILETALDQAWDKHSGCSPADDVAAAKKVGDLNAKISDAAALLAGLLAERAGLVERHSLCDGASLGADPVDFWDALGAAAAQDQFRGWAATEQAEMQAFFRVAREQSRARPGWGAVLGQLAARPSDPACPTDAGALAVAGPRTNSNEWSRAALILIGALDCGWRGTYPDGFLLGRLGAGQLATLIEVVFAPPPDASINEEQMRKLLQRYQERKAVCMRASGAP